MSTEGITADWRCPECGGGNRLAAERCWICLAPRGGSPHTTTVPARPGFDDFQPLPPLQAPSSRIPLYTGIILVVICVLLGLVTYGIGLLLFLPLAPALIRLFRAGSAAVSAGGKQTVLEGIAAWFAAVSLTLLVVSSSFIVFVAVCFPPGFYAFCQNFEAKKPDEFAERVALVGGVLGLAGASLVAWLIVRAFFPRRKAGGE